MFRAGQGGNRPAICQRPCLLILMGFELTAGLGCIVASKSTHCAQERPYGHRVQSTTLFTNYPMSHRSFTQMLTLNLNLTTQKGFRDTLFEAVCH